MGQHLAVTDDIMNKFMKAEEWMPIIMLPLSFYGALAAPKAKNAEAYIGKA